MPRIELRRASGGMTLPELLLGVLIVGLLASLVVSGTGRALARTRVEAATRQLALGLEQARQAAESAGQPCSLALDDRGWADLSAGDGVPGLPGCTFSARRLQSGITLRHNLPTALRISSTGLVLDGGTVVVTAEGSDLQRCLVVSLPLGVVRLGRSSIGSASLPRSTDCVVDPSL